MESNQDRSVIPRPSHELTTLQIGGNQILGEMVENSLTLARDAAYEAEQADLLVREARRIQRSGAATAAGEVEAFNLFLQAAKAGHSEAQYEVGFCFAFAVGVSYDSVKSEQWIGLAAENGFTPKQTSLLEKEIIALTNAADQLSREIRKLTTQGNRAKRSLLELRVWNQ